MNQSQPNQYNLSVVSHGEPTGNTPQSARVYFDIDPNSRQSFDLTILADTQDFKEIQTVYIDNYDCDGDLILEIPETQQRIVCKAGLQGYFPLLTYTRLKVVVWHKGTKKVNIPIYFLNFIISQGTW